MASVIHGDFEWDDEKAKSNAAKHGVSFEEAVTVFLDSSARERPRGWREKPMSSEERDMEPSSESLEELPEVDFSKAIRPNRYANLRGEFKHAVFLDKELWEHFGSEERVLEALRLLVDLASRDARRAS